MSDTLDILNDIETKEDSVEDLLNSKEIDSDEQKVKTLISSFRSERNKTDFKNVKIPEQIALKCDMTFRKMKEFIENSKNEELNKEFSLYKEALKIKFFADGDRDTKKDMQNNYDLGIDGKSIAPIGFYFDMKDNVAIQKSLDVIIKSTQLQREKNMKEAKAMGIDVVMSKKEEIELEKDLKDLDL